MSTSQKKKNIVRSILEWFILAGTAIGFILGAIFYIEGVSSAKYERIEEEVRIIQSDLKNIYEKNNELIHILGTLEGKVEQMCSK